MNFIAIMIALGVETFYKPISQWRNYQWFTRYEGWMYSKLEGFSFRDSPVSVILIFGLVFILTAILTTALYDLLAILGFLFATLLLIYCLGPGDLEEDVHAYLHAIEHDDDEAASHYAEKVIGYVFAGTPSEVIRKVKASVFIQGNSRMLGVLFWFVILGPAGALLYRLSDVQNRVYMNQQSEYAQHQRLFSILSWVPVRLSVLGYAIVGSFIDTMSKWQGMADFWKEDNDTLMIISGMGALQHDENIDHEEGEPLDTTDVIEALALVKRTLIFWLAVLAVLTLTGTFF